MASDGRGRTAKKRKNERDCGGDAVLSKLGIVSISVSTVPDDMANTQCYTVLSDGNYSATFEVWN